MPFVKLKELFALTDHQMSMSPGIVEKDFWVVWMLDYLYAHCPSVKWVVPVGGAKLWYTVADENRRQDGNW